MKYSNFFLIFIFLISINVFAREVGETEITTEDGIEVYQSEKYYLLKKNVKINSDTFTLQADNVRIDFNENLYDITKLNAIGNVNFSSPAYGINGNGENLEFLVKLEKLQIKGKGSKLYLEDIEMLSDGSIKLNNVNGNFSLDGINSKLINSSIFIEARSIDGTFSSNNGKKQIIFLNIIDNNIAHVKNSDTEMYARKINFNYETSIIELINDVTIIRNGEKIIGDYGTLDTKNNSYKIKSNNQTAVKVIIKNDE